MPTIEQGYIVRDKKKERYTVAKLDVLEQITSQMAHELQYSFANKPKICHNLKSPLFGYRTSKHYCSVYYMNGMDFGNGTLQFSGRLNYDSPYIRKLTNNLDYQTMDFRFGVIKCPKEHHEIVLLLNKDVQKHIKIL